MSMNLTVDLPEDWAVIPADGRSEAVDALLAPLAEADDASRRVVREYVEAVAEVLRGAGVLALAVMMHYDDDPPSLVQATCAWALQSLDPRAERPFEALVAASPFTAMDRTIGQFHGKGGDGARSLTFRRATELTDGAGRWPYILEARYAVPAVPGVAILLHFESLTVLYAEELEGLFDAIAATAAVRQAQLG